MLRVVVLESLGYDCSMVFINTDLDKALHRNNNRSRKVPDDFIKNVHEMSSDNKEFYKSKFNHFYEIDNNEGELTEKVILDAYKKTTSFFDSNIINPIGKRTKLKMIEKKESYLSPAILEKSQIGSTLRNWFI